MAASTFDSDTSVERNADGRWRKAPPGDPDAALPVDDMPTSRMLRLWLVGGRYELYEQVSAGGMGRVFRAVHRDLGRAFAVKLMLDGQQHRQESRERFFVEARLASSLAHPNIVSVTDYGVDDQHGCYIVMELLDGDTVRARMSEGQMSERLAFDVVDQLTGAVRYMHARGIIHGDIKPENVFLSRVEGEPRRRNIVKLLDFGLSFRHGDAPEHKLGGTPPYIAPERLQGAPPSPSCDVYSLGALLYELLTDRPVYTGTVNQLIQKSVVGPLPKPPSEIRPGSTNSGLDALVMRALARDPAQRHPTAEAFHFELRTVMNMTGLTVRRSDRARPRQVVAPSTRAAIEAALDAAGRGDLAAVKRILAEAQQRIDTIGALIAVTDQPKSQLLHLGRDDDDGIEEP